MHHLLRVIENCFGSDAARAILGWGLILFSGLCLGIGLILILEDIRILLLEWWSPQWRAAHDPHGFKRNTFVRDGLVWTVPVFLMTLGIGIALVWLVWIVPVFLWALGIGITIALRPRRTRTTMTEQEWCECKYPWLMLDFLRRRSGDWKRQLLGWFGSPRFRLSRCKLRRVSEAACRAWARRCGLPPPREEAACNRHPVPPGQACNGCSGSGVRPGTMAVPCAHCKGRGLIRPAELREPLFHIDMAGAEGAGLACPTCNGRGLFIPDPCPNCRGSGSSENRSPWPAWVMDSNPAGDIWGGGAWADRLFGVSLPGEQGGQLLVAAMAGWDALRDWPAEVVALWRLAVWARGMADEFDSAGTPTVAQFFFSGWTEADKQLIGEEACDLLREIFGDPFHPVVLAPAWRDATIRELAAAAHGDPGQSVEFLDSRHLAALARALEGTEGDNAEAVSHLREPGPHVRGCWVVDLILGKQ
jgi:hypothetical protein